VRPETVDELAAADVGFAALDRSRAQPLVDVEQRRGEEVRETLEVVEQRPARDPGPAADLDGGRSRVAPVDQGRDRRSISWRRVEAERSS